jgi:hypothetical protein
MALICSQLSCEHCAVAARVDCRRLKSKRGERSRGRRDGMRGCKGRDGFNSFAVILCRRSTGRAAIVQ